MASPAPAAVSGKLQLARERPIVHAAMLASKLRNAAPWLLLVLGIYLVSNAAKQPAAYPPGSVFPNQPIPLPNGARLDLTAAQPQITVLNFWASYCAPCRTEAPILSALQSASVRVIGLSIEALSAAQMQRAADEFGMRYPIAACDRALLDRLQIRAVPTTYVIAKDGVITLSRVGTVTREELVAAIDAAKQRG